MLPPFIRRPEYVLFHTVYSVIPAQPSSEHLITCALHFDIACQPPILAHLGTDFYTSCRRQTYPEAIIPWTAFPPLPSPTQSVTLGTEFGLSEGTFMLSLHHRNATANTTQVNKQLIGAREAAHTVVDFCALVDRSAAATVVQNGFRVIPR